MDEKEKKHLPVFETPRTVGCAFSFETQGTLLNVVAKDQAELVAVLNILTTAPAIADFLKIEKPKEKK